MVPRPFVGLQKVVAVSKQGGSLGFCQADGFLELRVPKYKSSMAEPVDHVLERCSGLQFDLLLSFQVRSLLGHLGGCQGRS